jgi:hypothetical protein
VFYFPCEKENIHNYPKKFHFTFLIIHWRNTIAATLPQTAGVWRQKVAILLRDAEVGAAEAGGLEPGAAGGRRGTEAVPGGQGVGTVGVGSHHTGPAL